MFFWIFLVVGFLLFIFFFVISSSVAAWEEFWGFSGSYSGHWEGFGGMGWSLNQYGALARGYVSLA